jgi:hypothetical protein
MSVEVDLGDSKRMSARKLTDLTLELWRKAHDPNAQRVCGSTAIDSERAPNWYADEAQIGFRR